MTIFTNKRTLVLLLATLVALFLIFGFYSLFSSLHLPNIGFPFQPGSVEDSEVSAGVDVAEKSAKTGEDTPGNVSKTAAIENSAFNLNEDFFATYRMDRDRVRGQQVELLQSVVDDPNSDAAMRKEAQARLLEISKSMDQELQLEALIKAKGFSEAAIFIQPKSATAILEKENLSEVEVTAVADIISRVTGHNLEDIVVIPR